MSEQAPILFLSHLLWERTLFQRPQQLATRLAGRGHPALYVSRMASREWLRHRLSGRNDLLRSRADEPVRWVNRPYIPLWRRLGALERLDRAWTTRIAKRWLRGKSEPILWLWHPALLPLVDRIPHRLLVFDVMDPFTAFRQSQPAFVAQERELLRRADVVFTGGVAMHRPVVEVRPDAHCFSSGVELANFARARDPETPLAEDLRGIPGPILGYFGAIDERMDFDTLREICRRRRDWSVVLLGPLLGGTEITVDEPNFHWLGPKPYDALPTYLKGFDVCLIPWVKNELTDQMSPTKTPEYLAGGKPVVSVPIKDVVGNYGDISLFAETPDEWIAACEKALATERDWAATIVDHPHARSWDQIAEAMDAIIEAALQRDSSADPAA